MKRQGISGLSVAAVADGSVLYVDGFGKDGSGAAIGTDTPVYAPAAAKPLAALAAASLESDRRISLDQLGPILPALVRLRATEGRPYRARPHRPRERGLGLDLRRRASRRPLISRSAARSMLKAVPTDAPGERFHYIETDYQVLALAMEKAAGMPYAAILKYRVFAPLGMRSSSATGRAACRAGSASFFSLPLPRAAPRSAFGAPSGYIVTTASDMGQYMAFLLGPGKFGTRPGDRSAPRADLLVPLEQAATYGYGLSSRSSKEGRLDYSDGSIDGFSSRIDLWPDERTGIALMSAQDSLLLSAHLPAGARARAHVGSCSRAARRVPSPSAGSIFCSPSWPWCTCPRWPSRPAAPSDGPRRSRTGPKRRDRAARP